MWYIHSLYDIIYLYLSGGMMRKFYIGVNCNLVNFLSKKLEDKI